MTTRRRFMAALAGLAMPAALPLRASAGRVTRDEIGDQVQTLPKGQLPDFAETPELRELYRYALEHKDELRYIPCTCGCGKFGHKDNRHCYVKAEHADGSVTFTSHAAT
jgi:hypothetical protein